jgi:predicted nuclease of predicted toxin-antitoxin system
VSGEGLADALDPDVVPAATAAGRILLTLDLGMGDIRACPPGGHAGTVVLPLGGQSAAEASRAIGDLMGLTKPACLAAAVAVLQRGLLRIRRP